MINKQTTVLVLSAGADGGERMQNMNNTNSQSKVHEQNRSHRASVRTADAYASDLEYGGALYEEVRDEMRMLRLRDANRQSIVDSPN